VTPLDVFLYGLAGVGVLAVLCVAGVVVFAFAAWFGGKL
jgi:hypothetical protein